MSAFPTLSVAPNYPLSPDGEVEDNIIRSQQTAGYEQTRPRFTRARRMFGLTYVLKTSDANTLRTFEVTTLHYGADAFTWTHPISAITYTVRLTAPMKFSLDNYGETTVSFTIREV